MPETIDRYEILQKLAAGGMAELFLAKQSGMEGFEKVVVIKRILTHLATDQEFINMFLDEARIAAKLSHPNVVQIYDLGRADDTFYIAMEYVSGRNVAAVIKKAKDANKPLPVEHVARVISGVCDGLYYAHTRKDYDGKPLNIIHRDISPQNILVSFAGGVKLVDFGIAKASTQLAQTRAGVLKGKYSYMSPEQVRGDKIDGRSDLFAVGIVMYEMLTATRPFERDSSLKTLKAIVQEKPINPRELNPSVPPEMVKILSKALEKDPNRRYANAQEMQLALEDWLDRSPNKSNNVRISRYLYELFDDELNSEGGTLEVKGIGEIIIPTGTHDVVKPADVEVEEVPESTLMAALQDIKDPKAAAKEDAARNGEAKGKPASTTPAPS
ncbi:MAG: serine/threonine-protein kinase, partial [Myxococcota bacterium]